MSCAINVLLPKGAAEEEITQILNLATIYRALRVSEKNAKPKEIRRYIEF